MGYKKLFVVSLILGFATIASIRFAFAAFSDEGTSLDNMFQAADVFPSGAATASASPSGSPAGTPSALPSPTPSVAHLVINEVFFNIDAAHGTDSQININVTGGGTGSQTSVMVNETTTSSSGQSNTSQNNASVSQNANTGNNQVLGNSTSSAITTGSISQSVSITNTVNSNNSGGNGNGNANGKNDEWVELYNPTDHDINLKNFKFVDNGGTATINANRIIEAGKFALVSKDSSTWTFWTLPIGVFKFPLGQEIGNGLENGGNRLLLKDGGGATIDALSWGTDTSIFTLPSVVAGHSLSRKAPGFDTDTVFDWLDLTTPTPGL